MFRAPIPGNVYLELLEERHAPELFAAVEHDRQYLREWLSWVDATTSEDDVLAYIRGALEQFTQGKGFAAGIWQNRRLIGTISAHKVDLVNRHADIGYWLAERAQGQGIITSAARAVITHLFEDLGLNRVTIHCATGNDKSAAIARRLGFTLESVERETNLLHGRFLDMLVFAMLKREWPGVAS